MKSIIQHDTEHCFLCGRHKNADYYGLDCHHVYGGNPNKELSEKYGLKVYLCHFNCHIFGKDSVHQNGKTNRLVKSIVQKRAMQHYGWTEQEFIKIFGKSYIGGDQVD